ncbi:MAG: 50S ribosomal protein L5 [Candidatus Aenigmarchaeota archaeon]|nr:50S ribosomal protein L5 [Candidatus Aenigmarchaeota archaeon]
MQMLEHKQNPMKAIRVEKIVLNIGCGSDKDPQIAKYLLEKISGNKAVITYAKKRTTWGVGKGKPIGAKVTIRKNCGDLLKKLLDAVDMKLNKNSFDDTGNVAFGINEYVEIPGMQYDPKIGMIGFDTCVRLERLGYRVSRKKLRGKIGKNHRIKPDEAAEFIQRNFGIKVVEEEVE